MWNNLCLRAARYHQLVEPVRRSALWLKFISRADKVVPVCLCQQQITRFLILSLQQSLFLVFICRTDWGHCKPVSEQSKDLSWSLGVSLSGEQLCKCVHCLWFPWFAEIEAKKKKKKGACQVIHKRSRLPMTYWYSLALLPLENGTLGNTQLSCRPYQIKGSLPGKKKKKLYLLNSDALYQMTHCHTSLFSLN